MKKYDGLTEIQLNLLIQEGVIDLIGEVDTNMSIYVREALIRARGSDKKHGELPRLKVLISSDGGFITQGFEIFDAICNYPGHVTGVVQGASRSMATVILQACDLRQATENAKLMIHNPVARNVSWDVLTNRRKLALTIAQMRKSRKKVIDCLAYNSGRTFKEIAAQCSKNKDFTAQEAKAFGLVDEIIKSAKPSR